jgi:glycosyltransferase involved in cell wall biosynthesis
VAQGASDLADAVVELLRRPDLASAAMESGMDYVREHYSAERMTTALRAVFGSTEVRLPVSPP